MSDQVALDWIPLDAIEFDELNPQEQDLATFNELVEGFQKDGWTLDSMTVIVLSVDEDGNPKTYKCVSGEHRAKAAKVAGLTLGPAIIVPVGQWDQDRRRIEMVRANALRGKLNPDTFTKLWLELSKRYGRESLTKMMGFGPKEAQLQQLVRQTKAALPERMAKELGERADRIRSVEDLASVVQSIFARHGSTLNEHYVLFAFGGRTHAMIRATPATFRVVEKWLEGLGGVRADDALVALLAKEVPDAPAAAEAPAGKKGKATPAVGAVN